MSDQGSAAAGKANRDCVASIRACKTEVNSLPTLLSVCWVTPGALCPGLVPVVPNRGGQAGEGAEKGQEQDPRAGKSNL